MLRLPELIVIFVVALLIFGPKKLPEMSAQIGRTLNAFKKGMSEFNRDVMDSSSSTYTDDLKALELRRLELEILERELAVKRVEVELARGQQLSIPAYSHAEAEHKVVESIAEPSAARPQV